MLGLVFQQFLVFGGPLGAIANAPLEAKLIKHFLALLGEWSVLSLNKVLILLTLAGDPVSKSRNLALARDQDMPMLFLVLLQLIIVLLPVLFATSCKSKANAFEDINLVLCEGRLSLLFTELVVLAQLNDPSMQFLVVIVGTLDRNTAIIFGSVKHELEEHLVPISLLFRSGRFDWSHRRSLGGSRGLLGFQRFLLCGGRSSCRRSSRCIVAFLPLLVLGGFSTICGWSLIVLVLGGLCYLLGSSRFLLDGATIPCAAARRTGGVGLLRCWRLFTFATVRGRLHGARYSNNCTVIWTWTKK
mmetsp:Transcript_17666/g.28565  ORF Transcript_17666/g.28565 Transcript_17666/m.28565 type:complete len:301 (-) Transcript_17666:34-936(-)